MLKKLLLPEDARRFLARRYANQHQNWLAQEGTWPLTYSLGVPTENQVAEDTRGVRAWVDAWVGWSGPGSVTWTERRWARLGQQRLPASLVFSSPFEVAAASGHGSRWKRAVERHEHLVRRWPLLAGDSGLARHFEVLADYAAADFQRLVSLLAWFEQNPASDVYLRQLPVEGLDTKWIETRTGVVTGLLRMLRPEMGEGDFYSFCGLRRPPYRLRVRLLCPELRQSVGGLRDIEAPVDELLSLPIAPIGAVIVENLETGIALPNMRGVVAVMKLGNAVSVLDAFPWLQRAKAVYWGDIDTHGFAILDRARRVLPELTSVLMDRETLLAYQPLWGNEAVQHSSTEMPLLNGAERAVYDGLRGQLWGPNVRLEQERLPLAMATRAIADALALY
jgi:hypothetical protein